jgi:hypothetical protein
VPFLGPENVPFLGPEKLRNCLETFRNGQERWTVCNVHIVQDERSETFAKSRSRFNKMRF